MKRLIIISCFLFCSSFIFAQESWELTQDKDSIFIYTKKDSISSFKSFRAVTIMECSIERFIYEINNLNGFKDWGYKIREVELLEKSNDTMQIYYAISGAPFPFKNRDGIYKNTFKWDKNKEILKIEIDVLDTYKPVYKKYVRVKGNGFWLVKHDSKGSLKVYFELAIDPGGVIPPWMANMFVTDSPYSTLKNLKEIVENKKVAIPNYSFMK